MSISQLKYFIEISKHGSITEASRQLHIAQPTISIAIRNLEEELGVKLFYRRKGHIQLTDEGRHFLEGATKILGDIDQLEADMIELSNKRKNLKIGASMTASYMFRDAFDQFTKSNPDIKLEICEYNSTEMEKLILDDELDIGIGMITERTSDRFSSTEIASGSIVFCINRDSPLAQYEKITVEDLKNQPLILARNDIYHTGEIVLERFHKANIVPEIRLWTPQFVTSSRYVIEQGLGSFEVKIFAEAVPEIACIPLDPPIVLKIGLIWKKGLYLGSTVLKFINFISRNQKSF
ncbi:MAG: LysR family transcriptional regulator [Enterocloster asparagiformis]|nr:LysR family transcriptional regulator [Enterocloster asparagiformis]